MYVHQPSETEKAGIELRRKGFREVSIFCHIFAKANWYVRGKYGHKLFRLNSKLGENKKKMLLEPNEM